MLYAQIGQQWSKLEVFLLWFSLTELLLIIIQEFQIRYLYDEKKLRNELIETQKDKIEDLETDVLNREDNNELPSYIKSNPLNRIDNKVYNKLRAIGCESNLIPEIFEWFRLKYNFNIYIYNFYYDSFMQIVIEVKSNNTIDDRKEIEEHCFHANGNQSYYKTCEIAIENALIRIQEYNLKPNL